MQYEEIHRFDNGFTDKDGALCWDVEMLIGEILAGMKKCKALGKIPASVSIDTWGIDFVLLDQDERRIGNTVAYRDPRTDGMDDIVGGIISGEELYRRTGIQKMIFNTIYQLMAVKTSTDLLDKAAHFVLIPSYLHYLLCGVIANEYTNATTTQLVNVDTGDWDDELIDRCGYPREIFDRIVPPGTTLGKLTDKVREEVGYDCDVVLPATHDTASAVMAVPANTDALYISSGTWSLMGVERKQADCSDESMKINFTNEGGYDKRYRYLKNIMGFWMIQCVKRELNNAYTYDQLCDMAAQQTIPSIIDCNDHRFLAPRSMIEEIRRYCADTGQQRPDGPGEVAAVVYNSLVKCYKTTIGKIESIAKKTYDVVHVVGGGSKDTYMNQLIADHTGKTVYAGPIEATAVGNLMAQMIAAGELKNLAEARECVRKSFDIKIYNPK